MADKEKATEVNLTEASTETVSKAEYDRLTADYQKLIRAFNQLLKEYNELHIAVLLNPEETK